MKQKNIKPNLEKENNSTINKALNVFIYVLIFMFCVVFDKKSAFPADGLRWLWLNISAFLLPFLAVFFLLRKKVILTISFFHIVVFSFLVWFSLSGIWTIDKANYVEQLVNHVSFIVLILFFSLYAGKLRINNLFYVFGISLLFISFIGVLQIFGIDGDFFKQTASPASTFINKNLATPLISLLLPFVFFGILTTKSKIWAIILAISYAFSLTYLLEAATRSSWLGVTLSAFIFMILQINKKFRGIIAANTLKRRYIYILGSILIALLLIFCKGFMKKSPLLTTTVAAQIESLFKFETDKDYLSENSDNKKTSELADESSNENKERKLPGFIPEEKNPTLVSNSTKSIQMRIGKWRNGLEMLKDKPLLGFGLGGFESGYPLYFKKVVKDIGYNGAYFHGGVHNDLFQFAIELGIIGLLLFILILFLTYYFLFKLIIHSNSREVIFFISCIVGITGLLIDSCFNYPLRHPTYMFIFAAIIGSISGIYYQKFPAKTIKINIRKLYINSFIIVFLVLIILSFQISAKRFKADRNLLTALQLEKKSNYKYSWQYLKKAIEDWPYRSSNLLRGTTMCFTNFTMEKSKRNLAEAKKYNNLALRNLPYHFHANYVDCGIYIEEKKWKKTPYPEEKIELMLSVAPEGELSIRAYSLVGYLYYAQQKYEKALGYYLKLEELAPENERTRHQVEKLRRLIDEDK
jgi:tetratricopeptide (TPR) repeat protein